MPTPADHPNAALLRAYAQGRLPVADAATLDRHVADCDECGNALAQVEMDTYSGLLQDQSTQIQTVVPVVPRPEIPPELQNHSRYELMECLGRGGMGVVYKALHRMMHRPVALKLIRSDLVASPEAVERFRREVRAAATLAHPNIVAAYDADEVAGVHFLVMEFVNGKTLDALVKKRGALPVPIACHLARQVAYGLDHAHARGMIHRDVKPLNLILADKSKVKILDFGLARWRRPDDDAESPTREGQALGTMLYSAPEQRLAAGSADARADQYGLGATLVFLLTGEHPIPGWALPPSVPTGVREVVSRLTATDPADRYPNMKAVAEALSPWCGNRPPEVETPSRFPRAAVVLAAGLALILVALGIWSITRDRSNSKTQPTTPATSTTTSLTAGPQWRSLLNFEPMNFAVAGDWRKEGSEVRVGAEIAARLAIPGTVPPEYDVRVSFTRETGSQSIGVIVVQNGRQVVFELDAWNKHLAGFQNVNGQSLETNPTRRDNVAIVNGQRYTILVEVRRDSLRGFLNGTELAHHRTDGRDLSLDNRAWQMPVKTCLALVAWNGATVFHEVEMRGR